MTHCLADRINERVWEVFCVDCKKSVGTMSGDTLQGAITFAVGLGGVKCPKCRKNSCRACGLPQRVNVVGNLCQFCQMEKEARDTELEETLV